MNQVEKEKRGRYKLPVPLLSNIWDPERKKMNVKAMRKVETDPGYSEYYSSGLTQS